MPAINDAIELTINNQTTTTAQRSDTQRADSDLPRAPHMAKDTSTRATTTDSIHALEVEQAAP